MFYGREMEDIEEDETDLQEQIFHNNVREQIVSTHRYLLFYFTDLGILFVYCMI